MVPPSSAFSAAISIINVGAVLCMIYAMIISGANFCQVARIIQVIHDIDVITDGNQKWNGAIPSLSMIADSRIIFI
jgi:hypothetical protein